MKDAKTKQELAKELRKLRGRVAVLEKSRRQRAQIEKALREAELFNQEVIAGAGEGIAVYDRAFRYVRWNQFMETMSGVPASEVLGKKALDIFPHLREQGIDRLLEQALAGEIVCSPDTPYYVPQTGKSGWVIGTYAPHRDAEGRTIGVVAIIHDISERKQFEDAVQKSEQYARSIIDSSLDMIITVDNERRIVEFNRAAQETFGYTRDEVIGKHIDVLYADPVAGRDVHRVTFELGKTTQDVLNKRKNGEVFASHVSAATLRDARGTLLGIVGVSRDITEQKRTEAALRQAEEKYRSIVDYAVEGIFQSTPAGRFLTANPALARMLGYASPQELISSITDIPQQAYANPAQRAEFRRLMEAQDEVQGFEFQVRRKDGSVMWVSENARAVRDPNGAIRYYEGTTQNITARKEAEEARLKFELGIERSGEAIFLTDLNGTITYVNPTFEKIYGYSKAAALGKTPRILKSGRLSQETYQHFWNALLAKQVVSGEIVNQAKDGRLLTIESSANPILNADGEIIGFLAIQRDVTDRKHIEEALRESEDRYRDLVEHSQDLISTHDLAGRILSVNRAVEKQLGYDGDILLRMNVRDILSPEVRSEFDTYLATVQKDGMAKGLMLVQTRTGEKQIWEYNNSLRTEGISVPIVRGRAHDVTTLKHKERALRESEARYRNLFENAPIALCELDCSELKRVMDTPCAADSQDLRSHVKHVSPEVEQPARLIKNRNVNQAMMVLYDATEKHLSQEPLSQRLVTDTSVVIRESLVALASGLRSSAREIEIHALSGETRIVSLSVTIAPDATETWDKVLVSLLDITERKQAEEAVHRRANEFAALYDITHDLATQQDLPTLLRTIVDRAAALLSAPGGGIYLYNTERDDLSLIAPKGSELTVGLRLRLGEGLAGRVAQTHQPMVVDDYSQWEHRSPQFEGIPITAVVQVPMLYGGDLIGVLAVHQIETTARKFTDSDARLLSLFAGQAASAVYNARLHTAEREQRQFAETLREIGIALTSQLDPDTVLDHLLEHVGRVVPFDSAAVLLLEENRVRCKRHRGYDKRGLTEWMHRFEIHLSGLASLTHIAKTGRPYVSSDTHVDPNWTVIEQTHHIRSWMGAPIHVRGTLIGFLGLDKFEPGFYTDKMAERLAAFATQAGLALENARLYAWQQQLATTDDLTGLFNRRRFWELAQHEFVRGQRLQSPCAVLMIDMNDFKAVNDTFGHSGGDEALQLVAQTLAKSVRGIDLVARYGGDEFVILLPDCRLPEAQQIAARMQQNCASLQISNADQSTTLSFTVGVAVSSLTPEETLESLLRRADTEMYQVKQQHKQSGLGV